jgi:hypothetical protein
VPENKSAPRGRGRPPTESVRMILRLRPADLAALDAWIAAQPDAPSRQDAIRRMITAAKNT